MTHFHGYLWDGRSADLNNRPMAERRRAWRICHRTQAGRSPARSAEPPRPAVRIRPLDRRRCDETVPDLQRSTATAPPLSRTTGHQPLVHWAPTTHLLLLPSTPR